MQRITAWLFAAPGSTNRCRGGKGTARPRSSSPPRSAWWCLFELILDGRGSFGLIATVHRLAVRPRPSLAGVGFGVALGCIGFEGPHDRLGVRPRPQRRAARHELADRHRDGRRLRVVTNLGAGKRTAYREAKQAEIAKTTSGDAGPRIRATRWAP